jgi:hypothetical protein
MAYPQVSAPYGLKPINLIGGQVFAGSTRQIPIQYGYATNIFYGDFVNISLVGTVTRQPVTDGSTLGKGGAGGGMVGIFLGCTYTNPTTKQKLFSQYWPSGTLAGDAFAYVTDDPDTLFKCAVVSSQGGTTIASGSTAFIGQNLVVSNLAGSTTTGDSKNAALTSNGLPSSSNTAYPLRVVDLVRDTAASASGTNGASACTSTTLTLASAITSFPANFSSLPVGTEVGYLDSSGQYVYSGSYVATAYSSGTSVTLNAAPGGAVASIPANATVVFTCYPELIVKINFGNHEYYSNTPNATI